MIVRTLLLLTLCFFSACNPILKSDPQDLDLENANLLIISLDTLRQDRLGFYGYPVPVSPFMDRLSQKCSVFSDVFAQSPSTVRSHRAIFSSKYVFAQEKQFPSATQTLAGVLNNNGWRTAGFVDGGLMNRQFGNHAGFTEYDDVGGGFEAILPKAFNWLTSIGRTRFFLFLHTYDIHFPYTPPYPFDQMFMPDRSAWFHLGAEHGHNYFNTLDLKPDDYEFIDGRYDGGIRYSDQRVESIFTWLQQRDLLESTIVIIVSDHGESLGERQYVGHNQLYNVQLKVPLFFYIPGACSKIDPVPGETVDIMPSILDLFNLEYSEKMQGKRLFADEISSRSRLSETAHKTIHGTDGWKLIIRGSSDVDELYDVNSDPDELNNRQLSEPDKAEFLRESYEKLTQTDLDSSRKKMAHPMIHIPLMSNDPDSEGARLMDQLKILGYVE